MRIELSFPGDSAIEARFDGHTVRTDQDGSVPSPFDLFLVSIATCTGTYVARFCQQRDLSTEGLEVVQTSEKDPNTGLIPHIDVQVRLPEGFPERYRTAVVRAAEQCTVKKHLQTAPEIAVRVVETVSESA